MIQIWKSAKNSSQVAL